MTAAVLVLPHVWATAASLEAPGSEPLAPQQGLHLVTPRPPLEAEPALEAQPEPPRQVAFYRKYTEALLRRYASMSLEAGRVPSLMGRELFRGDVSHCKVNGFDDVVHFVHDVGQCLKRLTPGQQHLIRRIAIQGYSQGDAAAMLGIGLRTVHRNYAEALDQLTSILMEVNLLNP